MRNTHIPPVSVEKLYLKSKKMETQVKSLLLNNTVNEKMQAEPFLTIYPNIIGK